MLELLHKCFKETVIILLSDIKTIRLVVNEDIRYLCKYWKSEILELKILTLEVKNPEIEIKGSVNLKTYS